MAKKISIRNISQRVNDFISAYKLGFKFTFLSPNSSESFENRTSMILSEFLPLAILISHEYYVSGKITEEKKKIFNEIISNELVRLGNAGLDDKDIQYFTSLGTKILLLDVTSEQYSKRDFIQFDSTSDKHEAAFKEPTLKRSPTNFVLKINGFGSEAAHVRIGVNINNDGVCVELVDIVNKRTGNE